MIYVHAYSYMLITCWHVYQLASSISATMLVCMYARMYVKVSSVPYLCWRTLTYADVCWRMLTYAGGCWHILVSIDSFGTSMWRGVAWRGVAYKHTAARSNPSNSLIHSKPLSVQTSQSKPFSLIAMIHVSGTAEHWCICVMFMNLLAWISSLAYLAPISFMYVPWFVYMQVCGVP
jgi:hypothetical protein